MPSERGSLVGAAVAASLTIPADDVRSATFSLAWVCPEINFADGRTYRRQVVLTFSTLFVHMKYHVSYAFPD